MATLERLVTDAIYVCLFGADGATLRARLGLPEEDTPDDERLRDEMGKNALHYLAAVEEGMTVYLHQYPDVQPMEASVAASRIAWAFAEDLRKVCAAEGVDTLTGKPI